jgi:hypothetical protein
MTFHPTAQLDDFSSNCSTRWLFIQLLNYKTSFSWSTRWLFIQLLNYKTSFSWSTSDSSSNCSTRWLHSVDQLDDFSSNCSTRWLYRLIQIVVLGRAVFTCPYHWDTRGVVSKNCLSSPYALFCCKGYCVASESEDDILTLDGEM